MKNFCENCRDYVNFNIKEQKSRKDIRGKSIEYTEKTAFCNECKNEIFVSELMDENLETIDKNYRLVENLISIDEIKEILNKYNIGKRPLSLVLGWGEGTLSRYIEGDIPTQQYSDVLKKIKKDAKFMLEKLNNNKERITKKAYKNCLEAIEKNIQLNCVLNINNEEKIHSVVQYIIYKSVEITPLALQKLLYYSQSFYYAFADELLFGDDCEAWVHGPVYKNVYYIYKDHGYNPIEEDVNTFIHFENLTEEEKTVIDSVILNFGCYSGRILEYMTHTESPWRETRKGLEDYESSDRIINKDLIKTYYKGVIKKYNMLNISDIRDYSTDLFSKIYH